MTEYKGPVIKDFARRTRVNLETLRGLQHHNPEAEVYEFTQLVNSMLGLLVFPKKEYFDHIRRTRNFSISDLAQQGWPIPKVTGNYPQVKTLSDLIRYLRNGIAHYSLEFLSRDTGELTGLRV